MASPYAELIKALQARGAYSEGMDSVEGCKYAAYVLFCEIEKHHGRDKARRIFDMWVGHAPAGGPLPKFPTKNKRRDIANAMLLDRYDKMPGTQSVRRLARELADERVRGITDTETHRTHLTRLIKKRELREGKIHNQKRGTRNKIHRKLRAELEKMRDDLKKL